MAKYTPSPTAKIRIEDIIPTGWDSEDECDEFETIVKCEEASEEIEESEDEDDHMGYMKYVHGLSPISRLPDTPARDETIQMMQDNRASTSRNTYQRIFPEENPSYKWPYIRPEALEESTDEEEEDTWQNPFAKNESANSHSFSEEERGDGNRFLSLPHGLKNVSFIMTNKWDEYEEPVYDTEEETKEEDAINEYIATMEDNESLEYPQLRKLKEHVYSGTSSVISSYRPP